MGACQSHTYLSLSALTLSATLALLSAERVQAQSDLTATAAAIEASGPAAQESEEEPLLPRITWQPGMRRFETGDWISTGAAVATLIGLTILGPNEDNATRGGILFDEEGRDFLRAPSEPGRRVAREISDVLLITTVSYPFLVDSLLVAAWLRDSPDVAIQLALINAQTLMITAGLQTISNIVSSRERPFGRTCGGELSEDSRMCDSQNRFRSFFSGHTSQAFAAAANSCMNHAYLPLYGEGAEKWIPCVLGMGMATATGMLRIVGDQHYATDVLTGAVVGSLSGFLIPWLLHYRGGGLEETEGPHVLVAPMPLGVGVVGSF